jgi:hypothetical protein
VLACFAVLALGPSLHVLGHHFAQIPLPYELLAHLLPPLRLSGTPVRFVVMVHLCAGILIAGAIGYFRTLQGPRRYACALLFVAVVLELHHLPMDKGFISRLPASVQARDDEVEGLYQKTDFAALCRQYGYRFVLLPHGSDAEQSLQRQGESPVHSSNGIDVFDVHRRWGCRRVPVT